MLDFLWDNMNLYSNDDIVQILMATQNLDGAYSEKYSAIVGELFLQNKPAFIKNLSAVGNPEQIERVTQTST